MAVPAYRRARQRLAAHTDVTLLDPLLRVAVAVLAQAAQDAASERPDLRDPARAWLDTEGQAWVEILVGDSARR